MMRRFDIDAFRGLFEPDRRGIIDEKAINEQTWELVEAYEALLAVSEAPAPVGEPTEVSRVDLLRAIATLEALADDAYSDIGAAHQEGGSATEEDKAKAYGLHRQAEAVKALAAAPAPVEPKPTHYDVRPDTYSDEIVRLPSHRVVPVFTVPVRRAAASEAFARGVPWEDEPRPSASEGA